MHHKKKKHREKKVGRAKENTKKGGGFHQTASTSIAGGGCCWGCAPSGVGGLPLMRFKVSNRRTKSQSSSCSNAFVWC